MISLRQSMKALDDTEAARRAAARAFADAVETSAEHVVEVNRAEAAEFREQVLKLAGRVSGSTTASDLDAARDVFRGELKEYSRRAGQQVRKMREELVAAADAMRTVAEGVSNSGGEHESTLKREFSQLQRTAERGDAGAMRTSIFETVEAVTRSFEGLKRSNALNIAQLRDEIRVLQAQLAEGSRAEGRRNVEAPEGFVSREALEREIEEFLRRDRAFTVGLIGVSGQHALYTAFPRERVDAALANMLGNLFELARRHGAAPRIAAWQRGVYALVAPSGTPIADWGAQLSLSHVFQADGLPRTIRITPRVAVVERSTRESHPAFFSRLAQATGALIMEDARDDSTDEAVEKV